MTLGGFLCIRNGLKLDYCFVEAIKSMLPVCDQIVVSESCSNDGTRQVLEQWKTHEPKLKIVDFPWPDPKGDPSFYPMWLNSARRELETEWALYLDADELLHEADYMRILDAAKQRRTILAYRYNFWGDAQSLIPIGECCGTEVIRIGPAHLDFPSDYPTPESETISRLAVPQKNIGIYHYGFLREREAFFRKAKAVQRIWANDYDPRLEAADKAGGNWMRNPVTVGWTDRLNRFDGTHPELIKPWLEKRGWHA